MNALTFEKTKVTNHNPAKTAKITNDITLLTTAEVLQRLYRRHDTAVWVTAFWLLAALFVWSELS